MKLWCGIVTDKVAESKAFYQRLFDFDVVYEGEDGWFVLLALDGCEIGFMKPGLPSQAAVFRPAYAGSGVWISIDVPDVDAERRRIGRLGIAIEQDLRDEPWGDRHFVVIDPNGLGIDIVQREHASA